MSFSTYCDPLSEFPKLLYVLDDVRIITIFHITLYLSMIDTEEKMVYDKKKKKVYHAVEGIFRILCC